jgi:hypothetical protein
MRLPNAELEEPSRSVALSNAAMPITFCKAAMADARGPSVAAAVEAGTSEYTPAPLASTTRRRRALSMKNKLPHASVAILRVGATSAEAMGPSL